jgi:hypothetical protein
VDLSDDYGLSFAELAGHLANGQVDSPNWVRYHSILEARVAEAQVAAAEATARAAQAGHRTAIWTKAAATVAAAGLLGTASLGLGAFLTQQDAAREGERQTCLARVDNQIAIDESFAPVSGNAVLQFRQNNYKLQTDLNNAC